MSPRGCPSHQELSANVAHCLGDVPLVRLETYPALIREDPAQHPSTVTERRAFGDNGGGHGVVSTNADAHQDSHAKQIPELVPRRAAHVVGQADDQYDTYDHDDHLFSIDKSSAKGIAHKTKRQLTNDITDVGGGVDGTTKQERVGDSLGRWLFVTPPIFVSPYRGDQVDDEEIVGVEKESDTMGVLVGPTMTWCICISPADGV